MERLMRPIITAKKFTITDDVRERFEKKLKTLNKFFPEDTEATVKVYQERGRETVEITIYRGGVIFRAEETEKTYSAALDKCIDVLTRQIRKNRTRIEKQLRRDIPIEYGDVPDSVLEDEDKLVITKAKKFDIQSMNVEEAIMQMNLLSHKFFLFRNSENGMLNVVYKRKENEYGLIEPND